ncbi:MAG: type VI secretion system tube protein Hcp [Burkholderiales bacterium]|nr:type VI secretion system tube protein Hcp [Burkholderiales bacterium]MDE1926082.1 type VI secretion system tube protein Hcp [Burkholderiales bacterium]MDE2159236.1 type VI secretion system tube protein Hcp [Burkholderiales bacterium]MDE2502791.1 type VI secretion system tube protein Hcp [Burkholderiales bacterium]
MTTDTHIKFDGVEGESTHQDHKGEIVLLSWSWNASNASSVAAGSGSGTGKAQPGELHFTHTYDKASPVLAKKLAQGVHFGQVVLTARKSGDGQKDFLKVTMKEVFVTGIAPSAGSDGTIIESVSLSYGSIEFGYKPQDEKGALGGEVKFSWNTKTTAIA